MTCRKLPLDTAFIPMQVPPNATLTGPLFLGSSSAPGMGVLVNNWLGDLPNNGEPASSRGGKKSRASFANTSLCSSVVSSGYYMSVFTEIGCIPMTFMSFAESSGYTMLR